MLLIYLPNPSASSVSVRRTIGSTVIATTEVLRKSNLYSETPGGEGC
jgi:hypothetical protein